MANYYAITSTHQKRYYGREGNERVGRNWWVLAGPYSTRTEAKQKGEEKIGPITNSYGEALGFGRETQHKNLLVVSKSQLRHYRIKEDV